MKYSRLFTAANAVSHEPVTIRVELIETEDFQGVSVESLEGEYPFASEFERACKHPGNPGKIMNFLPLTLPGARRLADALNEALEAVEGS